MMTGRGFMVWADGRRYDGEWLENRCNGRGVLTYKDGRRYEVQPTPVFRGFVMTKSRKASYL